MCPGDGVSQEVAGVVAKLDPGVAGRTEDGVLGCPKPDVWGQGGNIGLQIKRLDLCTIITD